MPQTNSSARVFILRVCVCFFIIRQQCIFYLYIFSNLFNNILPYFCDNSLILLRPLIFQTPPPYPAHTSSHLKLWRYHDKASPLFLSTLHKYSFRNELAFMYFRPPLFLFLSSSYTTFTFHETVRFCDPTPVTLCKFQCLNWIWIPLDIKLICYLEKLKKIFFM